MLAREETMASSILGDTIARAYPVVETDGSDSSMLDNTLEFLMYSGIEVPKIDTDFAAYMWVFHRK